MQGQLRGARVPNISPNCRQVELCQVRKMWSMRSDDYRRRCRFESSPKSHVNGLSLDSLAESMGWFTAEIGLILVPGRMAQYPFGLDLRRNRRYLLL